MSPAIEPARTEARTAAHDAQVALDRLSGALDTLATALDRLPGSAVDAGRCIARAHEVRGAAKQLVEWQGELRRLRVPGVDVE